MAVADSLGIFAGKAISCHSHLRSFDLIQIQLIDICRASQLCYCISRSVGSRHFALKS